MNTDKYIDAIMNGKDKIATSWGIKSKEGIKEMFLKGGEALEALMNGKEFINTGFGKKRLEGIRDMRDRAFGKEGSLSNSNWVKIKSDDIKVSAVKYNITPEFIKKLDRLIDNNYHISSNKEVAKITGNDKFVEVYDILNKFWEAVNEAMGYTPQSMIDLEMEINDKLRSKVDMKNNPELIGYI